MRARDGHGNLTKETSMNIKVKCDKCSDEFVLSEKNLKNVNVKIKSDDVNIKYFQCPRCKYLFIAQIDNAETDKLLKNAEDFICVISLLFLHRQGK